MNALMPPYPPLVRESLQCAVPRLHHGALPFVTDGPPLLTKGKTFSMTFALAG